MSLSYDPSKVFNSPMNLSDNPNNPMQQSQQVGWGVRKLSYQKVPAGSNHVPQIAMTPKLKCFELLAIRQKNKAEKKAKKAQNVGEDEARLDTTVTVLDIDEIDPIHGTFKMKFKVHAIYKFDEKKLKATVSYKYIFFVQLNVYTIFNIQEGDSDDTPTYPLNVDHSAETNATTEQEETTTQKTPAEIEAEEKEEQMLQRISTKNAKSPGNVFYRLFYKKYTDEELEKLKKEPGSVKPKIKPAKAISMEDDDGNQTETYVKSYSLSAEETKLFLEYYSVPIISIENLKTEAGSPPINWEDDNRITLYFEALEKESKFKEGQLSIMWSRDYEYVMKEVFELDKFPFDFQVLKKKIQRNYSYFSWNYYDNPLNFILYVGFISRLCN